MERLSGYSLPPISPFFRITVQKRLHENHSHTLSLRVSSDMINACDNYCVCAMMSLFCISCVSLSVQVEGNPKQACVHLCVHTCICMEQQVYTTVLAQGLSRWHCVRFMCVLISASFLPLTLTPVFCWSVYPALSRLSHKTCFLLVTFFY